jgi:uncharacterized protein (DUF885 family)
MATEDNEANRLADEMLDRWFEAEPLHPTLLGIPGHDERLADLSAEAEQRLRFDLASFAERGDALAASTVDTADALTATVVAQQARVRIDTLDAGLIEYGISDRMGSPVAEMFMYLPMITLSGADAARDLVTRLGALPTYIAQATQRHREGLAAGLAPVSLLVEGAIAQLDRYLADGPAALLAAQQAPRDAPSFVDDRTRVLADAVWPALARYRDVLSAEFLAAGRSADRAGLCWLPGGDERYAALARAHTTTDWSPERMHQTGLDLMVGLAEEFAEVGGRVFGTRDPAAIFARLRDDPALRWHDGEELLAAARAAIARAEAEAPRWFGRIPSERCRVEPVPAASAPAAPGAYYMVPTLDGSRPGIYYANTYHAEERGRYTSEVTAFHEAVPGHHFQLSLALGLTELPLLRRLADVNAYAEGWGLYCERLAEEMGLYSDDVARLGMLTMDAMRAGRLVVDTGLHAKGWSRQQAIDYLTENTPMPVLEIVSEVDRYIASPGQALSYMVGRLEIQRIRAEAQRRLGDRFDIRAFHDRLLADGSLPMTVLDQVISGWVDDVGAAATGS